MSRCPKTPLAARFGSAVSTPRRPDRSTPKCSSSSATGSPSDHPTRSSPEGSPRVSESCRAGFDPPIYPGRWRDVIRGVSSSRSHSPLWRSNPRREPFTRTRSGPRKNTSPPQQNLWMPWAEPRSWHPQICRKNRKSGRSRIRTVCVLHHFNHFCKPRTAKSAAHGAGSSRAGKLLGLRIWLPKDLHLAMDQLNSRNRPDVLNTGNEPPQHTPHPAMPRWSARAGMRGSLWHPHQRPVHWYGYGIEPARPALQPP